MTAPRPMRPGFVVELQSPDGALRERIVTRAVRTALSAYRKFVSGYTERQVLVLHDEREITGQQLRDMAEKRNVAIKRGPTA